MFNCYKAYLMKMNYALYIKFQKILWAQFGCVYKIGYVYLNVLCVLPWLKRIGCCHGWCLLDAQIIARCSR